MDIMTCFDFRVSFYFYNRCHDVRYNGRILCARVAPARRQSRVCRAHCRSLHFASGSPDDFFCRYILVCTINRCKHFNFRSWNGDLTTELQSFAEVLLRHTTEGPGFVKLRCHYRHWMGWRPSRIQSPSTANHTSRRRVSAGSHASQHFEFISILFSFVGQEMYLTQYVNSLKHETVRQSRDLSNLVSNIQTYDCS
jgi:hypothetical protein